MKVLFVTLLFILVPLSCMGSRWSSFQEPTLATNKDPDMYLVFETTEASQTIRIPTTGSNFYMVYWGDGDSEGVLNSTPPTHTYDDAGEYNVRITGDCTSFSFNNDIYAHFLKEVISIGHTGITSLVGAFYGCSNLISFSFGTTDTSTFTSFANMFTGCTNLVSVNLSGVDTGLINTLTQMFSGCSSLVSLDISWFNTSSVTNMSEMFKDCTSLQYVQSDNVDTSSVSNMDSMFQGCIVLRQSIAHFDVSGLTTAVTMFDGTKAPDYNRTLIWWSNQIVQSGVVIDFGSAKYQEITAKGVLTDAPNNWVISDGGIKL